MRPFQFWILLVGSTFVSVLLIKQIFLERTLLQAQRGLINTQEMASTGPAFESAWKQLAVHVYQASRQDPALAEVLKNAKIEIHNKPAAESGVQPAATPSVPTVSP
jgi:hypothetical protein